MKLLLLPTPPDGDTEPAAAAWVTTSFGSVVVPVVSALIMRARPAAETDHVGAELSTSPESLPPNFEIEVLEMFVSPVALNAKSLYAEVENDAIVMRVFVCSVFEVLP